MYSVYIAAHWFWVDTFRATSGWLSSTEEIHFLLFVFVVMWWKRAIFSISGADSKEYGCWRWNNAFSRWNNRTYSRNHRTKSEATTGWFPCWSWSFSLPRPFLFFSFVRVKNQRAVFSFFSFFSLKVHFWLQLQRRAAQVKPELRLRNLGFEHHSEKAFYYSQVSTHSGIHPSCAACL